jgi:ABC-2 type transport system ATP-binding protein
MSVNVIETRGLTKRFGDKLALRNMDLCIPAGGVHALIGSNGAGKSTLFRVLLGFLTADSGDSLILGEDSRRITPELRGRVGYVNEEHTLPDWLQVRRLKTMQQALYPRWNDKVYREVVGNFDVDPAQRIGSLSRGERAGVNLAMALAQSPALLILDEPTLGLDVVARQAFLDAVMFCTQSDTTVVYCSHQMDEVERLAESLIILERGEVRMNCSLDNFSTRVQEWVVPVSYRALVLETVPQLLSSRVIDDCLWMYVLDAPPAFASQLKLMGIQDATGTAVSLPEAVRAFLTRHHAGQE